MSTVEAEIRRLLKSPAEIVAVPAPGSKPLGTYEDFDACVRANVDKDDPRGYCGAIQAAVEGKETPWVDVKPWKGWTFETFIGSEDVVDLQRERVRNEDYVANLPFLVKYGYFEWIHTGQKIGEPVAWRYLTNPKTGHPAPMIRVGLIDPDDPTVPDIMRGELRGAKAAIEAMASAGQTSIKGMWAKREECDGKVCWKVTEHMALWAVGWVANRAANPAADVTNVSGTASKMDAKQPRDPAAVCGQLWFHGSDAQREAFGGGTEGRGPDEPPPGSWWDECLAHVEKSSEKDLSAFMRAYPSGFRYKAEALIERGCPPCRERYDSMVRAGFGHEKALAAVQEAVDAVTGWKGNRPQTLKSGPATMRNKKGVPPMSPEAEGSGASGSANVIPPAAGSAGDGVSGEIAMAALAELGKRLEALELAAQSTTPKMVDEALKPVREAVAKVRDEDVKMIRTAMTKIDARLGSLEAFAGRATLGLGSKSFTPPPRDTGPKPGLTTKQVIEHIAGARNFGDLNLRLRKAAKGPGGD